MIWQSALFLLAFGGLTWMQIRREIRSKRYKTVFLYSAVMLIAISLGLWELSGAHVPSPHRPLEAAFKAFGRGLFHGQ
ncbi:hypothetical protein [Paenibacillus ginsengarvi]|uniref:Uncharacterized protein n=1 Tax=Paenibacillus ginsengarvi TaxID=400777 RepID=A0A3B0ATA8_9BACL|nr:hypothetical protein [Paenibacillus ginsengarvi]RKN64070.1 hypothetical protein D7M11_34365 [Paenibacillus ginsengarvi]